MNLISFKHLVIGLCMFAAAGMALALKPTEKVADAGPKVDLEVLIPKQFGDWKIDETIGQLIANPEQQAAIDKIYNQTLSRTYINSRNDRIMLSIAYGGDQSDSMQVHRPEYCYPAQGFQIEKRMLGMVSTHYGNLEVRRLLTRRQARVEPLTYWIVTGGKLSVSGLERKIAQMRYGLTGKIPDGVLFRVSNVSSDMEGAYAVQNKFVNDLLDSLDEDSRSQLIGKQG